MIYKGSKTAYYTPSFEPPFKAILRPFKALSLRSATPPPRKLSVA